MKNTYRSLCLLFTAVLLHAGTLLSQPDTMLLPPAVEEPVYEFVTTQPEFPGGMDSLTTYIRYPETAKEAGIEGTVFLKFIVEKDGTLSDITVARGVRDWPAFEEEAVRAIKRSPLWIPGKMQDNVVRTRMTIPVKFSLPGK